MFEKCDWTKRFDKYSQALVFEFFFSSCGLNIKKQAIPEIFETATGFPVKT